MKKFLLLVPALLIASPAYSDAAAEKTSTVVEICIVCHGMDGSGVGFDDVPIIAGTPVV